MDRNRLWIPLFLTALFWAVVPVSASAEGWALADENMSFERVTDRSAFISMVSKGELKRFGMTLVVKPDGDITGSAFGRRVSGNWSWKNGYFCRNLFWGTRDIGPNCQEVKVGSKFMRFTSDQGNGQYADFVLK